MGGVYGVAVCFRYEQRLREQGGEREDLSDMVAEHAAKQSVGNR